MKAYKVTVLVVDHEGIGAKSVGEEVRRSRYINPLVLDIEEADIGAWSDEHPLNHIDTFKAETEKLFHPKRNAE